MSNQPVEDWLKSRRRKYDNLIRRYEKVKDWISAYATNTREHYMLGLQNFVEISKIDPDQFLNLEPSEAREHLWKTCEKLIGEGRAGEALKTKKALKSFYDYYNEDNNRIIRFKRIHRIRVPLKKHTMKHIPTHMEIYAIIDAAESLRTKAMISLMYNTGLSPLGLCNLNVVDFKTALESEEIPAEIIIDERIEPKRFTGIILSRIVLIDEDCKDLLRAYYNETHQNSQDDKPFFINRFGERPDSKGLWSLIKRPMKSVHILNPKKTWPYLIRDAYYNRLLSGGMQNQHTEYLMGHSLGVSRHYYDENKQEIRHQYLRCGFNRESGTLEMENLRQQLEEEQKRVKELEGKLSDENIRDKVYNYLRDTIPPEIADLVLKQKGTINHNNNNYEHKIIGDSEIVAYLDQGWEIVKEMKNKTVIRKQK